MSFLLIFISFNLKRNSFNLTTQCCHSISRGLVRISSQIPLSISFIGTRIHTLNVRIRLTYNKNAVVLFNVYHNHLIVTAWLIHFFNVFNWIFYSSFYIFFPVIQSLITLYIIHTMTCVYISFPSSSLVSISLCYNSLTNFNIKYRSDFKVHKVCIIYSNRCNEGNKEPKQ